MSNKGLAVVGLTSRIDAINLLEKRVKSRFSGRVIRTTVTPTIQQWLALTRRALCPQKSTLQQDEDVLKEWDSAWDTRVSELLGDRAVVDVIKETIGFAKDSSLLFRILVSVITFLASNLGLTTTYRQIQSFNYLLILLFPLLRHYCRQSHRNVADLSYMRF